MSLATTTPIFRFLHIDNLPVYLRRGMLHSPNHTPDDGLAYRTIHNEDIQQRRRVTRIPCGPGGVIHDYVSFYFGPRSPMLYQLHTGWVQGYCEGQEPLIYLVSTAQTVAASGAEFVFSDGHGIAHFTHWFDNLANLNELDWEAIYATYWADDIEHMDRQRRKQAEFLVHCRCDWSLILEIGVLNDGMRSRVEEVMNRFPEALCRPVNVRTDWYY